MTQVIKQVQFPLINVHKLCWWLREKPREAVLEAGHRWTDGRELTAEGAVPRPPGPGFARLYCLTFTLSQALSSARRTSLTAWSYWYVVLTVLLLSRAKVTWTCTWTWNVFLWYICLEAYTLTLFLTKSWIHPALGAIRRSIVCMYVLYASCLVRRNYISPTEKAAKYWASNRIVMGAPPFNDRSPLRHQDGELYSMVNNRSGPERGENWVGSRGQKRRPLGQCRWCMNAWARAAAGLRNARRQPATVPMYARPISSSRGVTHPKMRPFPPIEVSPIPERGPHVSSVLFSGPFTSFLPSPILLSLGFTR